MEQTLREAADLLGEPLTDPRDLGGSTRSTVLRARTASGRDVVVKAFAQAPEAGRSFTGEAAGLALGVGGADLLAADPARRLLVQTDLGDLPTLADLLLGEDPEAATAALLAWAAGLGDLAVAAAPRRAEFDALWARYDQGLPSWDREPWHAENATGLLTALAGAGVAPAPGLAAELAGVAELLTDRYPAFTPGDTCADNNLITPDGLRLIDFEAACYLSVFLTAAYCRMPFSSCWCVFTLPPELAAQVERTYRERVVRIHPELADDEVWTAGLAAAVALWTVDLTARQLPRVLTGDAPVHPRRRPVPTRRQLLRHRWARAAELPGLPALTATMRELLALSDDWQVPDLPHYPAFRSVGLSSGDRAGS
ncbi:hypothetical protein [Kitasatospora viridis]|uniref:Phosphotransferase family enzyme n=1 Tax=Kitasatospora viridis TaxID=281105 RepID=A0A561UPF1_9ACTN|nr:hypothetical protein [Kitasatospora viridis]TWG01214.1 hypothetical protein FHX73_115106 [Kitasatospora viridis]